jgi:hypothetical protein
VRNFHYESNTVIGFFPSTLSFSCQYLSTIAHIQRVQKVAVHLGYGTQIWLSVSKLPLQCAVVSLYSVVKQRLKCNTGKFCNRLIQILLSIVPSIELQHLS